mmetsp:Transcript_17280/g.23802  ORF Transcript_17280/g.23802 Transcript_17280/m.23802 type:complete len:93 (+) Transcript_17280:950-1228(+)
MCKSNEAPRHVTGDETRNSARCEGTLNKALESPSGSGRMVYGMLSVLSAILVPIASSGNVFSKTMCSCGSSAVYFVCELAIDHVEACRSLTV